MRLLDGSWFVERLGRDVLRDVETVVSFQVVAGEREGIEHARRSGVLPENFHCARRLPDRG